MLAFDTNILVYALNASAREHGAARGFLESLQDREDVVVCELVLIEAYVLLRNPVVFPKPCTASQAVSIIEPFRRHRHWRLVDYPGGGGLTEPLWKEAGQNGVARHRIYDVRLALTLRHHGVRELVTANPGHFKGLGFERIWSPLPG